MIEMPREKVVRNAILDPDRLVGQTPRRLIGANTPLRPSDVQAPIVIAKGTLVTVMLQTDRMMITARGRAMEDAAAGEVVRVLNTQSRTVIEGIAANSGTVLVHPPASGRGH
jgi:flagella basal body P-ring formation protein FlgA